MFGFPAPGEDIPRMYRGPFRNYVRAEDNYFCALLSAEAMVTKLETWFGVVHVQRDSSLGKRTKTDTDNGYLGIYLVYRALWAVAARGITTPCVSSRRSVCGSTGDWQTGVGARKAGNLLLQCDN